MGQNNRDKLRWVGPILGAAVAGWTFFSIPSLAQHVSGATGHASTGHMSAARPMGPGRSIGAPMRGGQRVGAIHANSLGASSAPPPSWELPRTVIPHWEIPSYIHVHPNPVKGNHLGRRNRVGYGVGYVGLPYYADPMGFVDADNEGDQENDTAQQAEPGAQNGPEYGPEGPYAEGPPGPYADQGYPPPPRPPYNPEAYQQQQQNSAAAQSDGLDHPAVTLVFNDGRPPMQVHSYVLTSSSIFVAEKGHQRVIPITDLDLPATVAQNREAGVDFELPGGSR